MQMNTRDNEDSSAKNLIYFIFPIIESVAFVIRLSYYFLI